MLKELFFPAKIGKKRIFSQKILGLAIHDETVAGSYVHAKRAHYVVENVFEETIEDPCEKDASIVAALKKIASKLPAYDEVRVAIPSSLVIFKEIEVPFINIDKIRMVLDYEIEPMLPFSLEQAIIDFVVTEQNKTQTTSRLLVAAIQTSTLQKEFSLYLQAGIEPSTITIDLLADYNLFQQIPKYNNMEGACALVNLGMTTTRISFILDGQLRLTRNVPRGIKSIIEQAIQDNESLTYQTTLQDLYGNGINLEKQEENSPINKQFVAFFNDIQFTLNSFSLKLNHYKGVAKILLSGKAREVKNLKEFCEELLQTSCEHFKIKEIFSSKIIKNHIRKKNVLWNHYGTSLGTAIPSEQQTTFDLRRKEFSLDTSNLVSKQLITACLLFFIITLSLGLTQYAQIKSLLQKTQSIRHREVHQLLAILPLKKQPKNPKLASLIRKAESLLNEKEEIWASFTQQRMNPLELLLEITSIMDIRHFNIDVKELAFREDTPGSPSVEIEGFFKSPRGIGFHVTDFYELEKRFTLSSLLIPAEPIAPIPSAEKGVRFTIKLKKKEANDD